MRVSVDTRDRGYVRGAARFKVYLNGAEFTRAVTADEEEGLIVAYMVAEDGKTLIKDETGQNLKLETFRGAVKIVEVQPPGLKEPKVKVERNSAMAVEVLVYSRMRKGHIRRLTLEADEANGLSDQQFEVKVAAMAGAGAEHLIEQHGDVFEPAECAKVAGELARAMRRVESAGSATRH